MHYFFSPLGHLRAIRRWASQHEFDVSLDAETFALQVSKQDTAINFFPKFVVETKAGLGYTSHFGDEGSFVGWTPYKLKAWASAIDKIIFKHFCKRAGLRCPVFWVDGMPLTGEFIIKKKQGSFGQGIRGPYRLNQASVAYPSIQEGEFFEQFIRGDCVKVWYWNTTPVALERLPPRYIESDGVRPLNELARSPRGSFDQFFEIGETEKDILAWQGVSATSILPKKQRVMLDFRYATRFDRMTTANRDVLLQQSNAIQQQVKYIGEKLIGAIPAEFLPNVIFTVDAVADLNDELWLLEMNSNPMIHPNCYQQILDYMMKESLQS